MLQPDIILPSQYLGPRRRLTPEHQLMIAVLRDAIDCVAKHRHAKDPRDRRLFDETVQWLLAEETDWPYSFEGICAVFDLDANAVRRALRLPEAQSSRELKKALRNHEDLKGANVAVKNGIARRTGHVLPAMHRREAAVVVRATRQDDLRVAD